MGNAAEKTHIREVSICREGGGDWGFDLTWEYRDRKSSGRGMGVKEATHHGTKRCNKKHKIVSLEEGDSCTGDEYHGRDSSKIKLCQPPSSPPPPSLPIVLARPEEPGGSEVVPGVRCRKRVVLTAVPASQVPSADTHQHSPACAPVLTPPPLPVSLWTVFRMPPLSSDTLWSAAAVHFLVKIFRFMCVIKGSSRRMHPACETVSSRKSIPAA